MSQNTKHHRVTNYRRRDLRNTLESRLGLPVEKRRLVPQLFRLKITNIGLDVSDYTILDIIKEFGEPEYINFRDHKDSRSCISDFKDNEIATKLIEKYNNFEINGKSIQVTLLDQQKGKGMPTKNVENLDMVPEVDMAAIIRSHKNQLNKEIRQLTN